MPLYQCDLIRFGIAQLPARRCIPALGDTFLLLSLADSLLQGGKLGLPLVAHGIEHVRPGNEPVCRREPVSLGSLPCMVLWPIIGSCPLLVKLVDGWDVCAMKAIP